MPIYGLVVSDLPELAAVQWPCSPHVLGYDLAAGGRLFG